MLCWTEVPVAKREEVGCVREAWDGDMVVIEKWPRGEAVTLVLVKYETAMSSAFFTVINPDKRSCWKMAFSLSESRGNGDMSWSSTLAGLSRDCRADIEGEMAEFGWFRVHDLKVSGLLWKCVGRCSKWQVPTCRWEAYIGCTPMLSEIYLYLNVHRARPMALQQHPAKYKKTVAKKTLKKL